MRTPPSPQVRSQVHQVPEQAGGVCIGFPRIRPLGACLCRRRSVLVSMHTAKVTVHHRHIDVALRSNDALSVRNRHWRMRSMSAIESATCVEPIRTGCVRVGECRIKESSDDVVTAVTINRNVNQTHPRTNTLCISPDIY
jgi:hypothetical protein